MVGLDDGVKLTFGFVIATTHRPRGLLAIGSIPQVGYRLRRISIIWATELGDWVRRFLDICRENCPVMNFAGNNHQAGRAPKLLPSIDQTREQKQRQECCTKMIHLKTMASFSRRSLHAIENRPRFPAICSRFVLHRQYTGVHDQYIQTITLPLEPLGETGHGSKVGQINLPRLARFE